MNKLITVLVFFCANAYAIGNINTDLRCAEQGCHATNDPETELWVDVINGSNNGTGTTQSPFKTIQSASDIVVPGQAVCVRPGTYTLNDEVKINTSGLPGEEIVFKSSQYRQAVLEGEGFELNGVSNVAIVDFKIINAPSNGIEMNGPDDKYGPPARNIYIKNNHTRNTYSSGIRIRGARSGVDDGDMDHIRGVLIEDNLIELANNGGYNEQITVVRGVRDVIIRRNTLREPGSSINGGEGIDVKDGVQNVWMYDNYIDGLLKRAIYVDGGEQATDDKGNIMVTGNIRIYRNKIRNIVDSGGIMVMSEGEGIVDGVYIYENDIKNTESLGIGVYKHPDEIGGISNIYIYDNTVEAAGQGGSHANYHIDHPTATVWVYENLSINPGNEHFKNRTGSSTVYIYDNIEID